METAYMSMDIEAVVYITEYYAAIRKKGNLAICDNMLEPKDIIQSEIRQTEKDRFFMVSHIYGI